MRKLPIVCVAVTTAASLVWADSTTIHPDADNTLIQTTDGSLSNALGDIYVGRTGQSDSASRRRGVIHFDVASAVPAGSTITAVTLRLYLALAADTSIRSVSLAGSVGQYFTWSSATMVSDVQGWLDSSSTNFGWHILGDESTGGTARRFTSREAVDDPGSHFPELVITYTPPAPFTAGPPRAATARIDGLRVLGERDLDGDGVPDLVLRDDRRGVLLGGHTTASGLTTWPLPLDRDSDDPLALPPQ